MLFFFCLFSLDLHVSVTHKQTKKKTRLAFLKKNYKRLFQDRFLQEFLFSFPLIVLLFSSLEKLYIIFIR